jgi:ABC-type branched-subunit amino acid transport system ATPase component
MRTLARKPRTNAPAAAWETDYPVAGPDGSVKARLIADGVSKTFGAVVALDDVSLCLRRGEIVGLMGPNGSGKSTLVNVISGVSAPTGGQVFLDSVLLTGRPADHVARSGIARTFQNVRLFKGLTVHDNVVSVMRGSYAGGVDARAVELLEKLGIAGLSRARAGDLPYGLQRRLEIARALATDPAFLLLDEPAAGLNDAESMDLEHAIRAVASDAHDPCGVLIIDHDMRLMASICDRLHVLFNGRTLAEGSPSEVRRDPEVISAYLGRAGSLAQPATPSGAVE